MFSHTELFITNTILSPVCSSAAFTGERDGFTALRLVSRGLWRAGPLFRAVCLKWWGISSHEEPLCFEGHCHYTPPALRPLTHSLEREREGERKRVKKGQRVGKRQWEKRKKLFGRQRQVVLISFMCLAVQSRGGTNQNPFSFPSSDTRR